MHWLGTVNCAWGTGQQVLPFKKALLKARSLKLKGGERVEGVARTPANIPRAYAVSAHL